MPHLWQRPQDIIHVPAFILFGYYFAVMKLYALFTLHEVSLLPCFLSLFIPFVFFDHITHPPSRNRLSLPPSFSLSIHYMIARFLMI